MGRDTIIQRSAGTHKNKKPACTKCKQAPTFGGYYVKWFSTQQT